MANFSSRIRPGVIAGSLIVVFAVSAVTDAADRPNRVTSSDVAAGRWMDAFLDPSTPLPSAQQQRRARPRRSVAQRSSDLRGKLVRNPDVEDGLPAFALVDKYGGVLRYVEPVKSVALEKHLDQTIAVRHDTGDILLASQLALPRVNNAAARSSTGLQLAQSLEPIPAGEPVTAAEPVPAGEVVGDSTPIEGYDNGPIYVDGGYDEGMNFGCPSCGDMQCGNGGGCGYGARGVMYIHAEYLLWRLKGMDTPPLVMQFDSIDSDGANGIDDDGNGVIDDDAAVGPFTVLFGDTETLDDQRSGGRITWGLWLDDYGQWGIEADYLWLEDLEENFTAGVFDSAAPAFGSYIGRPFFNSGVVGGSRGAAIQDVDTSASDGTVTVNINSEFRSAGLRLRHNLCCRPSCEPCCGDCVGCGSGVNCGSGCGAGVFEPIGPLRRLSTLLRKGTRHSDILYGIRWVSLDEGLRITEDLQDIRPPVTDPLNQIDVFDSFVVENDFFGGEIGYETDWKYRRWSLNLLTKIAIGNTHQEARNRGATFRDDIELNPPDNTGGLLVQSSTIDPDADPTTDNSFQVGNAGNFERDEFTMIPELGITLGYNLTRRFKLTGGYTVLYWGNVLRPAEQIDIDVNANLLPRDGGPALGTVVPGDHPRYEFRQSDLWAQGLNLGAEYTW